MHYSNSQGLSYIIAVMQTTNIDLILQIMVHLFRFRKQKYIYMLGSGSLIMVEGGGDRENLVQNHKQKREFLSENLHIPADSTQSMYLASCQTDPDTVQVIDTSGYHFVPELESNHEEADTRIILHVLHVLSLAERVKLLYNARTQMS